MSEMSEMNDQAWYRAQWSLDDFSLHGLACSMRIARGGPQPARAGAVMRAARRQRVVLSCRGTGHPVSVAAYKRMGPSDHSPVDDELYPNNSPR